MFSPLVKSVASSDGSPTPVTKKMQELEYALKAAFQNADIPLIELTLEPEMIEAAAKCEEAGKVLSLEELGFGGYQESVLLSSFSGREKVDDRYSKSDSNDS